MYTLENHPTLILPRPRALTVQWCSARQHGGARWWAHCVRVWSQWDKDEYMEHSGTPLSKFLQPSMQDICLIQECWIQVSKILFIWRTEYLCPLSENPAAKWNLLVSPMLPSSVYWQFLESIWKQHEKACPNTRIKIPFSVYVDLRLWSRKKLVVTSSNVDG